MTQPGHVFIVGSGRSGTSLMRRILNRSEEIAICDETLFLTRGPFRPGFRHTFAGIGDMSTDDGARRVVDYIYEGGHRRSFWGWIRSHVDRDYFLQRLLETDRSDRALFELVMVLYAAGKPVRGEKTPAHIYDVPILCEWFPDAKIVHMLRDPRAVFASKRVKIETQEWTSRYYRLVRKSGLTLNLYLCVAVLSSWKRIVRLHHRYKRIYSHNYCLIKFEDLIDDPRACLTELCGFLEVDVAEAMLDQSVVKSSFVPPDAQLEGFDISAVERWRGHLDPLVNRWFVTFCRRQLLEFGYRL